MNRDEVINIMLEIKKRKPNYFLNFSAQDKNNLVDEWVDRLSEYEYVTVLKLVLDSLNSHNRIPYPRDIIEAIQRNAIQNSISLTNGIYSRYGCPDGIIRYGESLYNELSRDDWYKIPADMMSRMEYDPSLNTPKQEAERQTLLQEALRLQALD